MNAPPEDQDHPWSGTPEWGISWLDNDVDPQNSQNKTEIVWEIRAVNSNTSTDFYIENSLRRNSYIGRFNNTNYYNYNF